VRARLLFLAEFTLLNGGRALKDAEALQPLIDINTAVMRGLSGDGGQPMSGLVLKLGPKERVDQRRGDRER
jgi:hypothetical protein